MIHAGKQIDEKFKLNSQQIEVIQINELEQLQNNDFTNSAIIGEVTIVDCIEDSDSIWAIQGQYHWVLRDPVLYDEPIRNVKGKLGLWEFNPQLT